MVVCTCQLYRRREGGTWFFVVDARSRRDAECFVSWRSSRELCV